MAAGVAQLLARFDARRGGFGDGPRFPSPHQVGLLLRAHARTGEAPPLRAATRTLDAILSGGLRDHLAGGFHRYTVDPDWRIPHFEKMLYDQAGLARAFLEAYQVTGREDYAAVARETLDFVLRRMRDAEGGFTSAWDADSEGVEGTCYLWTRAEVQAALGGDFELFAARYPVTPEGNFPGIPGANHLQRRPGPGDAARRPGPGGEARIAAARARLLAVRDRRVQPLHDDKVLTDWNGLMLGSFALAGRVLGEERYTAAAVEAATFVLARLRTADGALLHRYRAGRAGLPGLLDDHAFLAWGLVELYETTFDPRWLDEARRTADAMRSSFRDEAEGGFFQVPAGTELIFRPKPVYDGALPSGNAAAAFVLHRLGVMLQRDDYRAEAAASLESFAGLLRQAGGTAGAHALQALDFQVGPVREIVIAGDRAAPGTAALLAEVRRRFLPRSVVLHRPPGDAPAIAGLVPFLAAQRPVDGRPTAFVCENYACLAPAHTPAELAERLGDAGRPGG